MLVKLAPSVLSANFFDLKADVKNMGWIYSMLMLWMVFLFPTFHLEFQLLKR